MKKVLSLVLALALSVSMTACGQNNGSASSGTGSDESWAKIESAGELVVGLDDSFPPMGYTDTQTGELIGFDIDLAREAAKRLGVELKLQAIDWNSKQAELDNGNVDCLWNGFSKTPERAESFLLGIPYMSNEQVILVKTDSEYLSFEDLNGKRIGVQADSSAEYALNSVENKNFKSALKEVIKIDDYTQAILEIQNGTIDAIAIDEIVARFYLKDKPDAFRILESGGNPLSLSSEDYVIGMRKNDLALKEKLDGVLKDMAKDGTLKTISEKWFAEDITTVEVE